MRYTLTRKMGIVASIILLILATLIVTAVLTIHAGTTATNQSQEHLLTQVQQSKLLDRYLLQAITDATTFTRSGNPDEANEARTALGNAWTVLEKLEVDDHGHATVQTQEGLRHLEFEHKQREVAVAIHAAVVYLLDATEQGDSLAAGIAFGQLEALEPAVRDLDIALAGQLHTAALELSHERQLLEQRTILLLSGAVVSVMLVLIVVAVVVRRHIVAPLNILAEVAEQVADGDFTQQVTVTASDEIGIVQQSFNRMVSDLHRQTHLLAREQEQLEHQVVKRSQAEAALRESESALQAVFTAMTDVVLVLDRDGRYLPTVPERARNGDTAMYGSATHRLFPTTQADLFLGAIRQALDMRKTVTLEYPLEMSGVTRWFLGNVSPAQEDRVVWVARDITERKQTEEQLARLAEIVEASYDAILSTTLDGIVTSWNTAAERLSGVPAHHILGRPAATLFPPDHLHEVPTLLARVHEGERIEQHETVCRRADGRLIDVSLTISPILDHHAQPTGIAVIARDMSDRKQVERLKSEFVSTVSHELRTPLTSILGALGLVINGIAGEIPARATAMLQIAHTNSDRLVRLINDLLDMERMASGKMVFQMKPLSVQEIVDQALVANQAYAAQLNVGLSLTTPCCTTQVLGDSDRLQQVLANLLSNAAKFSPAGSTVAVMMTESEAHVRVAVVDRGVGIAPEFRNHIFEKFAQADSSTTRQTGGTGLGLSIAKAIVEKHGGQIGFESEMGQGSTFYIDLPRWQSVQIESPNVATTAPAVLICEDDSDIAALLSTLLRKNGYNTIVAHTAADAKQALQERSFAAMTLDIMLPDQNGLLLLHELREDAATRDLPVVVVSNLQPSEVVGHAIGIVDWLTKPIDTQRLLSTLNHILASTSEVPLCVLYVGQEPGLLQTTLTNISRQATVVCAQTSAAACLQLSARSFDLVVLDCDAEDQIMQDVVPRLNAAGGCLTPVLLVSPDLPPQNIAARLSDVLAASKVSTEQVASTIHTIISSRHEHALHV